MTVALTRAELALATDPAALLAFAWAMEPALRLTERYAALDRLEELIANGQAPPAPPGRDWEMELLAERAFDAAAYVRLLSGQELADRVLREADPSATIARARATLARGRALAWIGTAEATRQGDEVLRDAIEQFRLLGHSDWLGFTTFWRGHAICFQNGDLKQARALMAEALSILGPDSERRSSILTFYADVLLDLGDFGAADVALDEAATATERDGFDRSRAYLAWSRARVAAGRDDGQATARLLREVERHAGDWFATMTGLDFLADAAVQLDRVGLVDDSHTYLERARQRVRLEGPMTEDGSNYDEPLLVAEASILARSGDPHRAITMLQEVVRGNWLERRLLWRITLLTAWATLRAGERTSAGRIAARALTEAANTGGIEVAQAGEKLITQALVPLADETGSPLAHEILTGGHRVVVRLFGTLSIIGPDRRPIALPAGQPGELVRLMALHPHGLATETVLEMFFPEVEPGIARQRLRQVLKRLRAASGDLVLRDGERLTIAPAWIDVREFQALAEQARGAARPRARQLASAALALSGRGPTLATDPYAPWAEQVREEIAASTAGLSALLD